jgi:hypothetical protein
MRRLTCSCGGELSRPLPIHCPHCGKRITRVRRRTDWLGALIVLLLFAAVVLLLIWLTRGAADNRARPFGSSPAPGQGPE